MFVLFVAALQVQVITMPPMPAAPPPPPPFTPKVEAVAEQIAARVNDAFKRCGDASAYSNKYSVEAFGTPRFSAEWKKAADAMRNALTVCRDKRRELRKQKDFLLSVTRNGTKYDRQLAAGALVGLSYELHASEQYFATEKPRYRRLLIDGWGDPHCIDRPDGYMPASSVCRKGEQPSR